MLAGLPENLLRRWDKVKGDAMATPRILALKSGHE
jgi:hypothetical protein